MQRSSFMLFVTVVTLTGCTAFEDAEPTDRQSFVHFYSSAANYTGNVAEIDVDGGFILSGEVRHDDGSTSALIIKTDARGQKVWETMIPASVINAIRPTESHYILVGDSIELNPESTQVHELINTYSRVMLLDRNGNITARRITTDRVRQTESGVSTWLNVDYHGEAVTLDNNGNIIVLGSFREPGQSARAYLASYDPVTIDSLWQISYVNDHDYVNVHAVHVTPSSKVVWASKIFSATQSLTRQYAIFPFISLPAKTFKGAPKFGDTDTRNHTVEDMQRSPVGFVAIGTYAETNGESSNIYFLRLDSEFGIVDGSARYIDGQELLLNNTMLTKETRTTSASQDKGLAVTATDDGFVLACSITSTPIVGNGGDDVLLIKLDPFGNLLWHRLLGGSGDEVVSSIRETPDKGLLIFGTNTINGLSSMMLIKTDANGNLDN